MDYKRATAMLGLTGVVVTEAAINKAWKRKLTMCHPDKSESPNAHEATQLLNQAKDCMLRALEDGKFEDDAFAELNDVLTDFKKEMEEYNVEIKKNAVDCRERMKWFFRQDREKYLKLEGAALHSRINKKRKSKLPDDCSPDFKRSHVKLDRYEAGQAIIRKINALIDEELEYCPEFFTFTFQLLELYKKRNPEACPRVLYVCKWNLSRFITKKIANLRHMCFRGQRGYQHLRIKGQTEIHYLPPLKLRYQLLGEHEARTRWKVPESLKRRRSPNKPKEVKEEAPKASEQ